jgi:hypothetical protein
MNNPGSPTVTIADLIPKVQAALQNNPNANEKQLNPEMRPSAWLRDSLREITANYPFEELRTNGPLVTVGPGLGYGGSNYAYLVSFFINPGDDVTLMEDPVIFLNTQQAITAGTPVTAVTGNTVGYSMDYLTPKAIQPLLFITGGVPFKYTRFGTQFWFGSQPGQNYNVYLPYQIRHQFVDTDLKSSSVFVPPDWFDIIAYAAAERGAIANRWNDQASYLHNVLYGDPASQMKDGTLARPGLIAARVFQQERDRRLSTVQLTCFAQRY